MTHMEYEALFSQTKIRKDVYELCDTWISCFKGNILEHWNPGSSCSKLTMLLKLWSLNMAYTLIFLLKKCDLQKLLAFFQQKYLWIR